MVICMVISCSMQSDRDKGISFYRIPAVIRDCYECELELSIRRRDGFLAAVSREDIDIKGLEKYRICSHHFISGKPAGL